MAGIGLIIVFAAIIASMAFAMYMYTQYQTNFITANAGEYVTVGPVRYNITFDGTNLGNKEIQPENTFVKIKIEAENISEEPTTISGGQFYLVEESGVKNQAVYGEFSEADLLYHEFDPGNPRTWTTQFDIPYDEQKKYNILIRPSKEQSTVDTAMICITNC